MSEFIATVGGRDLPVRIERTARGFTARVHGRAVPVQLDTGRRALRSACVGSRRMRFGWQRTGEGEYDVLIDGRLYRVRLRDEIMARFQRSNSATPGEAGRVVVRAPIAGLVTSMGVRVGDAVEKGAPLAVLYAMKLENSIVAPRAGVVAEVHGEEGCAVDKNDPLVTLEG